jgi:DNA-binding transcriptional LysR family regulator
VPAEFDPEVSLRRFSIALSTHSILALSGLLQRVHELAPGAAFDTWPITTALLETGRGLPGYDVLIAPAGFRPDGEPEVLLRDRIVYVADPANSRLRDGRERFTAEDLAALPHAAARLQQADLVTSALAGLGVTPNVVATTGGWAPLPFLVAGSDLVAAVPERLARRVSDAAGVTVTDPPFGTIELIEAAWWHPAHNTDPALTWFRRIVAEVAASLSPGPVS